MLRELTNVRQIVGEGRRRWFSDPQAELVVWYDAEEKLLGFVLCYKVETGERGVVWRRASRAAFGGVDDGELFGRSKSTPVAHPCSGNSAFEVLAVFAGLSRGLDPEVRSLVLRTLVGLSEPSRRSAGVGT